MTYVCLNELWIGHPPGMESHRTDILFQFKNICKMYYLLETSTFQYISNKFLDLVYVITYKFQHTCATGLMCE